ncbi:MAG: DUF1289 domain-containing protein [Parvibaculum sp.]|uniref:DUF1289 domain-containing protein n=1 Tax=Parvibaculum sp. TaxID=2024848 RepID=UPI003C73B8FC
MTIAPPISSPCIDICELDPNGICTGCARTVREVACWGALSEADRRDIMSELPARIEALGEKAAAPEEALALIEAVLKRRA